ncbi:MAG: T9SS type A sorting domain-containing protein [Bacteroidota bacterium]
MTVIANPQMPGPISGPSTVCKSDRAVDYSIAPAAGAYHYLWSISGGAYLVTVATGLTTTIEFYWSLTGSALLSVQSANLCGYSSPQQKSITVNLACRTRNQVEDEFTAVVYPNPARESVTVDFQQAQSGKATIELLDVLGRSVLTRELDNLDSGAQRVELPLSSERSSSGIYLLRLISGVNVEEVRLVVE